MVEKAEAAPQTKNPRATGTIIKEPETQAKLKVPHFFKSVNSSWPKPIKGQAIMPPLPTAIWAVYKGGATRMIKLQRLKSTTTRAVAPKKQITALTRAVAPTKPKAVDLPLIGFFCSKHVPPTFPRLVPWSVNLPREQ